MAHCIYILYCVEIVTFQKKVFNNAEFTRFEADPYKVGKTNTVHPHRNVRASKYVNLCK